MGKIGNYICLASCLLLILVGAFFDLSITQNLYIGANAVSSILGIVAQSLMVLMGAFCLVVLFESAKEKNDFIFSCIKLAEIILAFVFVFYGFYKAYSAVWFLIISSFLSAIIVFFMWQIVKRIPQEKFGAYLSFCKKLLLYIVIIFVLNKGIKYVWGRPRYVDLITTLGLEAYSPFWQIHFCAGYESFYSGHTTAVCSVLPLLYVIKDLPYSNKIKNLLSFSLLCFVFVTMLSRLISGRHFLTDVVFAFLICFVVCLFIFKKTKIKQ